MSFTPIGSIIGNVLKQCRLTDDLDAYRVFTIWEDVVGSKIAIHARPAKIKGKILYVEVDDPLWHAQIKYMKRDIIGRLETYIKKGVFQDVKFYLK